MDFILNTKVARYLFALVIAMFGIAHFMNTAALAGAVPSFFPNPSFWVYLTGIAHLAAAVSIIVNIRTKLAMALLAVMLIIFALTTHLPFGMATMSQILKDLGMAVAAIYIGAHADK